MLKEKNAIDEKIRKLERDMVGLPDGKLICNRNGNSYKWYQSYVGYASKAFPKIKLYNSNGILPMEHLIMTFENEKDGFNVDRVKKLIKEYFL